MHDDEIQNKMQKLVQQLIAGTEKGKITWTDTGDADSFRANMQGGMVRVQKRMRYDEEGHEIEDFSLTLLDRKGRELEDYCPPGFALQSELSSLWALARRSARAAADVLEKLLEETAWEE